MAGLDPKPSFQELVSKVASFMPTRRPRLDDDSEDDAGEDPEDKALSENERDDVEQHAISVEDELAHTRKKRKRFHSRNMSDVHKKERFLMLCAEMWDLLND